MLANILTLGLASLYAIEAAGNPSLNRRTNLGNGKTLSRVQLIITKERRSRNVSFAYEKDYQGLDQP